MMFCFCCQSLALTPFGALARERAKEALILFNFDSDQPVSSIARAKESGRRRENGITFKLEGVENNKAATRL